VAPAKRPASTSPEDPSNDRSADDTEAALGVTALVDRGAEALETVRRQLAAGTARLGASSPGQKRAGVFRKLVTRVWA
jgi:hypothetical protein